MSEPLQALCGAERVDAAVRDIGLLAHNLSPAHRTFRRHFPTRLRLLDAHDLGNDVAGAVDDNASADIDALLVDLRFVVHRDVADGHAPDDHRLDVRDRREHARAAHVARDFLDLGLGLLRRVLEGDRPARRTGDETKLELLREVVDLDHDTIDLVLELVPLPLPLGVGLDDLVD